MLDSVLSPETSAENKQLNQLFSDYPQASFQPGSVIIRAGQTSPFLHFIAEGCVKMSTTTQSGRSVTLHLFQPCSCFSLLQALDAPNQKGYEYQAITPTLTNQVPLSDFLKLICSKPEIGFMFTKRMTRAIAGLLQRIEQSSFVPANQQLASLLLYFVRHYGEPTAKGVLINFWLKHHALAEWLGLTRENVSLQLKLLERNNYIQKDDNLILIPDLNRLEKLAAGSVSI